MNGDAQPPESDAEQLASPYRTGDEPIAGYCLIEPLGKGGFGEVWKCQAPGGFLKAIKFVQGATSATDDVQRWLAEQELQALEHIKNIRHPFILTVERAELQRGTLMIVMELAERSLADLLLECARRGENGIARVELLRYLREAAEALDLMNFQHGLQHLDVKPQNLFLIGGHVKVADLGLVNPLPAKKPSDRQDSKSTGGVHGITPRYVAPEILQHRISRRSDQYSLAIVFQELLTGELPFKGRTHRQLIMQHLQAQPDLTALPERDRDTVARALAKDPEERFVSCCDFVRALERSAPLGKSTLPEVNLAAGNRTDPMIQLKGKASLRGVTYGKSIGQTPLGEIWEVHAANGETLWAYHLQRFALEDTEKQEQALQYLQNVRHAALLRFKVAENTPHRIILLFEPWGPSLTERCRSGKLGEEDLLRALAEIAHAVDQLTAASNLEHLGLCPDGVVQGLDREQLRDFGLIATLWKSGNQPLDGVNPRYGAPELAQGRASTASDQYSLAVTYADLRTLQLTGKMWPLPRTVTRSRPAVIDLEGVPAPERQILRKALDPDPARRFASCVALVDGLAEAQGGAASQATTAVRSALAATQASFLATLHDWIAKQERDSQSEAGAGPASAGNLRTECTVEIVPGTVQLRLEVFEQEWHAQRTLARDPEYRYFLPLERSLWQRLRGRQVGVEVHILLKPIATRVPNRFHATLALSPINCGVDLTRQVNDTLAPALLQNLMRCLNAIRERRRGKRVPCRAAVTIRHRPPGGRPTEHHGELVNISRRNAGIVTTDPIAPRGEIRLGWTLPQTDEPPVAILLKATVKRCEPLPDGKYQLGAEFVSESGKEA
jgi:serine/threonine protein kinase